MEPLETPPETVEGDDQVHADDHPEVETVDEGMIRETEPEPEPDAE